MVKLNGKPGKYEASPSGGDKFGQEFYMTAVEMASMLPSLADEIEGRGVVEASAENWAVSVSPGSP